MRTRKRARVNNLDFLVREYNTSRMSGILIEKLEKAIGNMGEFKNDNPIASYVDYIASVPKPKPRLIERAKDFTYPEEVEKGLLMLESAIQNGDDLLPWLSTRYTADSCNEKDYMRLLFDITHFHLGEKIQNRGKLGNKIERTDYLLYAYVTEDIVYELGIEHHGAWGELRWQEIITTNWPDILPKGCILHGIVDVSGPIPDAKERLLLAKNGINSIGKIGEKFVLPMGGGVNGAGCSARAIIKSNKIKKHLRKIELKLSNHVSQAELEKFSVIVEREFFIVDGGSVFYQKCYI